MYLIDTMGGFEIEVTLNQLEAVQHRTFGEEARKYGLKLRNKKN